MKNRLVKFISALTTTQFDVSKDILMLQFTVVNSYFIGNSTKWFIVDTGLENSANYIIESAKQHFGENSSPAAIILTHGHFDHVGSLIKLLNKWDVPVYIHKLELPYITGKKDYPLADNTVDKGLVAKMSPSFPHTSIDIKNKALPLPDDGTIPGMPEWKWVHTPGHTEGHISLFRENDQTLIVGDAFCTIKQESITSVATQKRKINGPPKYLTTNWKQAEKSVELLKNLKPNLIIPSHGKPIQGEAAKNFINLLSEKFNKIAVPEQGKFVN